MFYDYHMHSNFSIDSKSSMEDMVKRSIELNLNEICFTDHVDYDLEPDFYLNYDYIKYFNSIEMLKKKYSDKISIKKGIELGLQSHIIEKCSQDVRMNPFDFVICSIHGVNTLDLYLSNYFKDKSQHEAYEGYYLELYNVVRNFKDYSVLGHLDVVKRYGNYPNVLDDSIFSDIIEAILKQAIHDGKGIEINTSNFRYNLSDLTPSRSILKLYKDLGGEIITTGSDSHMPTQVAYKFDYIYSVLKDFGFNYVCTFDKMQPNFIKI